LAYIRSNFDHHGAFRRHCFSDDIGRLRLFVSYHCERYNTSMGVLTREMFRYVFASTRAILGD
jgi:uracil-DNA glycosylase